MSFENAIAFAQDLIRIPSPPGGEGDVAGRVMQEMHALGFTDVRIDAVGNVIGRVKGRGSKPAVMLCSHLDIVDIGDPHTWEFDPFGGEIVNGFLHGRGAMDIKGPLAIQTYAAAAFLDDPLDNDIIVCHTVHEERGGWGMEHYLASGGERPGAVIIGEATNGDICIGHRGRAELIVEIQGLAGHASAPERARNPVLVLPLVIPEIERFAQSLVSNPVLGKSTMAPTAIETLPRSRNVIPDRVRIVIDWRVLPDVTPDSAIDSLTAALHKCVELPEGFAINVRYSFEHQHTYTGHERERRMFTPGFLLDPQHRIAKAAADVVAKAFGKQPALRPWTFATDGGHACGVHNIPTIGFAPGEERYAHTNRERLELESARKCFDVYPAVIRAVGGALA